MLDFARTPSETISPQEPGPIYEGITDIRQNSPRIPDQDFDTAHQAYIKLRAEYKTKLVFEEAA